MFQELLPVIQNRPLTITVACVQDGKIRVCVVPQSQESDDKINDKNYQKEVPKIPEASIKALTTALAITGTAEELDRELSGKLSTYAASHEQLQHGLAQATDEMKAALQAIEDRKKTKKTDNKTSPAPNADKREDKPAPAAPATLPLTWLAPAEPPAAVSAGDDANREEK